MAEMMMAIPCDALHEPLLVVVLLTGAEGSIAIN
jgi:hypothetical protein